MDAWALGFIVAVIALGVGYIAGTWTGFGSGWDSCYQYLMEKYDPDQAAWEKRFEEMKKLRRHF